MNTALYFRGRARNALLEPVVIHCFATLRQRSYS